MIDFFDTKFNKKSFTILCIFASLMFFILVYFVNEASNFFVTDSKSKIIVIFLFALIMIMTTLWLHVLKCFDKFIDFFAYTLIVVIALIIRMAALDFISHDYDNFLANWVSYFRENGGLKAIKDPIGDYNVVYVYFLAIISYFKTSDLYLIKIFSILFDFILGIYSIKFFRLFHKKSSMELFLLTGILLLPTVFFNSSWWAQCDSIFVAFGIMGLYYGLSDKPILSIMFFTMSFVFKLQSVFILPIIIVLFIGKKINLFELLIFPATYIITIIPAIFLGKPLLDSLLVYINQTQTYNNNLTLNSPSIYNFLPVYHESQISTLAFFGISLMLGFLICVFYYVFKNRNLLSNKLIFYIAVLFVMVIPFLLPYMHDRYFYFSDILAIIFVFVLGKKYFIAILAQLASLICYFKYLFGNNIHELFPTIFILVSIILVTNEIITLIKINRNIFNNEIKTIL